MLISNAGNICQRSDCFYSNAVLCISFMLQMVETLMIRLWVIEDANMRDQIPFHAPLLFLVEVQTKLVCYAPPH